MHQEPALMTCSLGTLLPLSWSYDTTALSCEARIPFQIILMERKHIETINELETVLFDHGTWLLSHRHMSSNSSNNFSCQKLLARSAWKAAGFGCVDWGKSALQMISTPVSNWTITGKCTNQCTSPTFDGRSPTAYDNAGASWRWIYDHQWLLPMIA